MFIHKKIFLITLKVASYPGTFHVSPVSPGSSKSPLPPSPSSVTVTVTTATYL